MAWTLEAGTSIIFVKPMEVGHAYINYQGFITAALAAENDMSKNILNRVLHASKGSELICLLALSVQYSN